MRTSVSSSRLVIEGNPLGPGGDSHRHKRQRAENPTIPPTVLASNAMSQVESAEVRAGSSVRWTVQYHPEYPLRELAAIVGRTTRAKRGRE